MLSSSSPARRRAALLTRPAALAGAVLVTAALLVGTGAGVAQANCGSPNYYALGTDTVGNRWGISGYITSYSISVPHQNYNFSDQALHAGTTSGQGLEVGWYVGWGNQTQSYVTDPHVYATANGPREVDGPDIGATTDYYYAFWESSGGREYYDVSSSTSNVFSGTISTNGYNGPGSISAVGEVDHSGLQMKGHYSSLKHMWSNGTWYSWTGMNTCADSGYTATRDSNTSMSDS